MSFNNTTDEQIAAQVVRIPEMFGFLIDRYEDKLDRYIERKTGLAKDQRVDILQDVFIRTYQNIASFDTRMSFNSWIYRICHNTLINDWKRNKRYREGISINEESAIILQQMVSESTIETEIDAILLQEKMKRAIDQLSDSYKTVITLFYLEHLSYEEISVVLELPIGTVGTRLNRARKKLLSLLEN
ncbi:MAG: RNA polymerase sigma factor [Patescibacteria group bacterium]